MGEISLSHLKRSVNLSIYYKNIAYFSEQLAIINRSHSSVNLPRKKRKAKMKTLPMSYWIGPIPYFIHSSLC